LLLRRATDTRSAGSWEAVHGHLEPDEDPVSAARRELTEETGLEAERWYNLSRVESFYVPRLGEVVLVPAFAVFVRGEVRLSAEHDQQRWLPIAEAEAAMSWPRTRRALADLRALLASGDAGPLEDVLRLG